MIYRLFKILPIILLAVSLLTDVALNLFYAANIPAAHPNDFKNIPEFAFGWLQAAVNGTIVMMLLCAMYALLKIQHRTDKGETVHFNGFDISALLLLAAFALPAVPSWIAAAINWHHISWREPRYLLTSICQLWLLYLLCSVVYKQVYLRKK